jgi:1,2-diacylglycerol 3-alpha-glucosyltransferase
MRILLTSESYLPYVSGVTVSVDALARGLGAAGHEVMVLAPRPADGTTVTEVGSPGPEPRYAWLPSYEVPRVAPPGYRMPVPSPMGPGPAAARAFEPDVVHAHSPFVTGLIAMRLARSAWRPLVFTHHTRFDDYAHYAGPASAVAAAVASAYIRRYWRRCAAVVAPSSDLADEIRSRLSGRRRPRVSVIPTGVDVDGIVARGSVDPRPVAGWPSDARVVATLGRLAPEKDPTTVLEAFIAVAARAPAARLLVVGGGPLEADLRARARATGMTDRVHFTGPLPRPDAVSLIGGADVFAFASRTETQGLVLAEALAAGVPAVAIDGPGVRDSVRDGVDGVVVADSPPAARSERIADAIVELLTDAPRRAEMAARARADAGRFAVERRVAEMVALYRSIGA